MPPNSARPWSLHADGVSIAVRLTPKGGRDWIDGVETLSDGRAVLKARVRAAAADGEANAALLHLFAKALGASLRDVKLVAGAASRLKRIAVAGDGPTLIAALEKICASL